MPHDFFWSYKTIGEMHIQDSCLASLGSKPTFRWENRCQMSGCSPCSNNEVINDHKTADRAGSLSSLSPLALLPILCQERSKRPGHDHHGGLKRDRHNSQKALSVMEYKESSRQQSKETLNLIKQSCLYCPNKRALLSIKGFLIKHEV